MWKKIIMQMASHVRQAKICQITPFLGLIAYWSLVNEDWKLCTGSYPMFMHSHIHCWNCCWGVETLQSLPSHGFGDVHCIVERALQFCSHPLLACPTFVPLQTFMYIIRNNFAIKNMITWRDRAWNFELESKIMCLYSNPFRRSEGFSGASHQMWTEL